MPPVSGDTTGRWGVIGPANDEGLCSHQMTRADRMHHGSFLVLSKVCVRCGKILSEEKVLALEHLRCPVDPRLDKCLLSCPVEDGLVGVFENPCGPVRVAMETSGFAATTPAKLSEPDAPQKESSSRLLKPSLRLRRPSATAGQVGRERKA